MHADDIMRSLCADVAAGRWHRGPLEVTREVEVAVIVVSEDRCHLVFLVRDAAPCASEIADFRLARDPNPSRVCFLYEVGHPQAIIIGNEHQRPHRMTSADVIVGFAASPTVAVDVRVALVGPHGDAHASYLRVNPEDGIVPALEGWTVLPVIAMPDCHMVDVIASAAHVHVRARIDSEKNTGIGMRAVCAQLRPELRKRVAARTFSALPSVLLRSYDAASLGLDHDTVYTDVEAAAAAAAASPLPDLARMVADAWRLPAERARHKRRHDAVFGELMERAWAPERVRRGGIDPDD